MKPSKSLAVKIAMSLVVGPIFGCAPSASDPMLNAPRNYDRQTRTQTTSVIQTVFIVLMENHDWREIQDNPSATYINGQLLPQSSYTSQYFNPPGIHPSLPNYLWLEAGTNFGIRDDGLPSVHHQATSDHLATLLENAGISWKTYQEGITGTDCPLTV